MFMQFQIFTNTSKEIERKQRFVPFIEYYNELSNILYVYTYAYSFLHISAFFIYSCISMYVRCIRIYLFVLYV